MASPSTAWRATRGAGPCRHTVLVRRELRPVRSAQVEPSGRGADAARSRAAQIVASEASLRPIPSSCRDRALRLHRARAPGRDGTRRARRRGALDARIPGAHRVGPAPGCARLSRRPRSTWPARRAPTSSRTSMTMSSTSRVPTRTSPSSQQRGAGPVRGDVRRRTGRRLDRAAPGRSLRRLRHRRDIRAEVDEVLHLVETRCPAFLGTEVRAACRRLLAAAARTTPTVFRQHAKPSRSATAVVWVIADATASSAADPVRCSCASCSPRSTSPAVSASAPRPAPCVGSPPARGPPRSGAHGSALSHVGVPRGVGGRPADARRVRGSWLSAPARPRTDGRITRYRMSARAGGSIR